ncbi:MAG: SRPBCC domain-containing protein [Nitrospira defluvii]|nr:SRPBCC domain-containing protein [Nitrospira defluvii]
MSVTTKTPQKDLIVTRIFDASVAQVWNAWVESELIMQWWGPNGFTSPSAKMDVREDGTSLVCMRAPNDFGGQDLYSTWTYQTIVRMERIDYIHSLADESGNRIDPASIGMPADFPQDLRNTVTFRVVDGNKTEVTVTEYDWPVGHMMEMSRMGMEQCLNKMAAIFAKT